MKALVLEEYSRFVYKDVSEPVLGTTGVMVRVKVEPFITAVAPFAEGAKWFRRLYRNEKDLLKVILEP